MKVNFFGYFEEFQNKDTVIISVPPRVFINTLNYVDIKTYIMPVGAAWEVKHIDFSNKKITGKIFVQITGFEPFHVTHEFDFEEIDINMNRNVAFAEVDKLTNETAASYAPCFIISSPIMTPATKLSLLCYQLTLNTRLNSKALRRGLTVNNEQKI